MGVRIDNKGLDLLGVRKLRLNTNIQNIKIYKNGLELPMLGV